MVDAASALGELSWLGCLYCSYILAETEMGVDQEQLLAGTHRSLAYTKLLLTIESDTVS